MQWNKLTVGSHASPLRGATGRVVAIAAAGAACAGLALASRRWWGSSGNRSVPQPRRDVDLGRYLGRWYELGRYDQRFEHDCENVSADYALRSDGLINIINTCRDARGRIRRVSTGRARLIPKSGGAKLKVSFFGPLFVGNYWILDRDDDYRWSIVGEPSGRYLWILSRDPVPPAELYASLLGRAQAMGFAMRQFRRTDQSAARSVGAG